MSRLTRDFTPAAPTRQGFSAEDFSRMIDAGAFRDMWVELIDGELERMPPPGRDHGRLQIGLLAQLLQMFPATRIFGDIGIAIDDDTVLACDAAVLRDETGSGTLVQSAEILIVVEIAQSTRDRDLGMKRRAYAAAGIPTYWVVDGDRSVIHVFDRPEGDDYMGIALVRFGDPLSVPGTGQAITLD